MRIPLPFKIQESSFLEVFRIPPLVDHWPESGLIPIPKSLPDPGDWVTFIDVRPTPGSGGGASLSSNTQAL